MAVLPSEIPTGLVTGQFYFVNEDNVDAGTDPDLLVVQGTVKFTCSAGVLRMPSKFATVIPMTFQAEFNSSGELVAPGVASLGLELPATDSALFNPTGFTWKVEFDLRDPLTGFSVNIPSFSIQVPTNGTVDLTTAMPVSTAPGTLTLQGPMGLQGPTGLKGDKGDKGDTGAPGTNGTNGASSNSDVATWVTNAGPTKTALDANYVRKGEVAIRMAEFAPAANGTTDDSAKITSAIAAANAAGLPLIFDGSKSYNINTGVTFTGRVYTYGCKFTKTVNNQTYVIRGGDGLIADVLRLETSGGALNDAGIYLNGDDIQVDKIVVTTLTSDQPGANALVLGNLSPGASKNRIKVNSVRLEGFQSPMRLIRLSDSRVSNGTINNFMTGVYIQDCEDLTMDKFRVKGTSAAAIGMAGQNGVLVESIGASNSCTNIRLRDWVVDGSAEHAYRMGGSLTISDITFEDCIARNPGNAAPTTDWPGGQATGGCGFKVLGALGQMHRDVRYINCSVEDANVTANGLNNFAGFHIGYCDGVEIMNPSIKAKNKTYSSRIGLMVFASRNVQMTDPNFRKIERYAISAIKDASETFGLENFRVNGGFIETTGPFMAISFNPLSNTFKDFFISNLTVSGGAQAFRPENVTTDGTTGAYTNVNVQINYINAPTGSTTPPITGGNVTVNDYTGPIYGSFSIPSADGGLYMNTTTGARYIRKAAAWVQE